MMMRTTLTAGALSLAWGAFVWAEVADFISPVIGSFEAGILCAQESGETREAPDTVAGTTHVIDEAPPFVSNGRAVPAVLGIGFGVKSGVAAEAGLADVRMTLTHPAFAGSGATEQSFTTYIGPATDPGLTFYQFDYGYELALGDWTMTAQAAGVTLFETTFTVVPPAALPELAGVCGYLDLLS